MSMIKVIGAKMHNLKNINVEIPKWKLVVITWVSWSWKSSLAFDTIYAEWQRRYVESLSAYARQFLQLTDKPEVESIEWLSPAIAINQKSISKNPRSTVWTITEIYDYLRLFFAKVGHPHCYKCWKQIIRHNIENIISDISNIKEWEKLMILAPIVKNKQWSHIKEIEKIEKDWFIRFRINWEIKTIADDIDFQDNWTNYNIEIVVDRIVTKDLEDKFIETSKWEKFEEINSNRTRLADSLELALKYWEWFVYILNADTNDLYKYSENFHCTDHEEVSFPEIEPRSFSFNSPHWACETCHWLGQVMQVNNDLIIPNTDLTIAQWALHPWASYDIEKNINYKVLSEIAKKYKFDFKTLFKDLSDEVKNIIINWTWEQKYSIDMESEWFAWKMSIKFHGIKSYIQRKYDEGSTEFWKANVEKYMQSSICNKCEWKRLRADILSITINDSNIIDITQNSILKINEFFENIENNLSKTENIIAKKIINEIKNRLNFLNDVWLSYLSLDRSATTLSWGEWQRIRLATQIWSALEGILYVLDEPSIWLHQKDNDKLISTMKYLKNLWNTVLVVEHDEDTMKAADYIIEIWPKAWKHWWEVIAVWDHDAIIKNEKSITWKYLNWTEKIDTPNKRRKWNWKFIELIWAKAHNLKNVDIKIPLWCFVGITWVSWSWKSTLINYTLVPELANKLNKSNAIGLEHEKILWIENLDKIISIDQSPIWRTPKSNPSTYTWIFSSIRELYSNQPESKMRWYKPWRFSFNVKWWRCEECSWDWMKKIEMHFLPDVYVPCEICKWKRYSRETLEITYKWKNIADVLNMTASEALSFFSQVPRIKNGLSTLEDVWLWYIQLGQPSTQLSGWEAQRIKLATELAKVETGKTIYILDEPTTGLHFDDIKKLLKVLNSLVEKWNSIIVIEHNLDVIKTCDYILDVWPDWWDDWWEIVAKWTPEEIIKEKKSHTALWLWKMLNN